MAFMFLNRPRSKRSNQSHSHVNPFTAGPGNLIPASFVRVYNGDRLRFNPSVFVQAFPMIAPLVNGFKVCLEYFFIPDRLYNVDLLLDRRDITHDPDSVMYPFVEAPAVPESTKLVLDSVDSVTNFARKIVLAGSLADFCNFPVGYFPFGLAGARQRFNALKVAGYLDVVNTYYVNQHVDRIPTAYWRPTGVAVGDPPVYNYSNVEFEHSYLQAFCDSVKMRSGGDIKVLGTSTDRIETLGTWEWLCSRASIFQRSFPDYYLESWLKTSGYEDASVNIKVDVTAESITMRDVSAGSHMQRFMDLAFGGGSRFSDFQASEFDTTSIKHVTSPLFLGADRQYLGSNVIYQTTGFENPDSPLGSFAGQSAGGQKFKTRTYKFGEPGYFMVMVSLVPDVIYSRGIDPLLRELTLGDTYAPALDNISMQPLMREELDAQGNVMFLRDEQNDALTINIDGGDVEFKNKALGYVPAWSHIMQTVSRAHGRTATSLGYWLLQRHYGLESATAEYARQWLEKFQVDNPGVDVSLYEAISGFIENSSNFKDFSPYIRTNAYNNVFSDKRHDAQNFVISLTNDIIVSRKKSKVNVPNTL